MKRKLNKKRGFTIIELLVVIGIIAVLVLLAAPKVLTHMEESRVAHIQNDVKVTEDLVSVYLTTEDNNDFTEYSLVAETPTGKIYDKKGIFAEGIGGDLYDVSNIIKSSLKGSFLSDPSGKVYYVDKARKADKIEDEVTEPEGIINDWHYYTRSELYKGAKRSMGIHAEIDPANIRFRDGFIGGQAKAAIIILLNKDKSTADDIRDKRSGMSGVNRPVSYGTYEAKIKLPEQRGLLSGFFMYNEDANGKPVEIDMEMLFIEGKWQLWLSAHNESNANYVYGAYLDDYDPNIEYSELGDNYAEPGIVYQKKIDFADLGIADPSSQYVDYKIKYYENNISFEVNNVEVGKFTKSFDYMELELITSTFWAQWLNKERLEISWYDEMNVEWIRTNVVK